MNFIRKIKNILDRNFKFHRQNIDLNMKILDQNEELLWAEIYHDSIKGKEELKNLSLNIGRWAGNYSFFYILHRILDTCKPSRILELGLGESSKFISVFISNYLPTTEHLIIEQSIDWQNQFIEQFDLSSNSKIKILPIEQIDIKGHAVNSYTGFDHEINDLFDFYLVDGPFGSNNFSRYDIINLIKKFPKDHEFVILFDDYDRKGEQQTVKILIEILQGNDFQIYQAVYKGLKTQIIIASEKFKFVQNF